MPYDWTDEQQTLFETVEAKLPDGTPKHTLIKVEAVAGASKTTSLVEVAKQFKTLNPAGTFRYMVFGNANAAEARQEFKTTAICSTTHALAYHYIIRAKRYPMSSNLLPFLSWRDIPKQIKIPFGATNLVLETIESYCNSVAPTFNEFLALGESIPAKIAHPAKQILLAMATGKMRAPHYFYLKLFQKDLATGKLEVPEADILAIDEAGDLTPLTLDIFHHLKAKQKIIVGDSAQEIMSFMGCVNAFDHYRNKGTTVTLSQSFRVTTKLAQGIRHFVNTTFDPSMVFLGHTYPPNPTITTEAIITRTNSSLVAQMIDLNKLNKPFRLISKAKTKQIFKYPLFLMYTKAGAKQFDDELKSLQKDVDTWYRLKALNRTADKLYPYLLKENSTNPALESAINLIMTYSFEDIDTAYKSADAHKNVNCNLILMTAHSSKGLTVDKVTLADDMNSSIKKVMTKIGMKHPLKAEEITELKLYYVATTRCRHVLDNATYIPQQS